MEAPITKPRLPAWAVYFIFGFLCLGVLFILRLIRPSTLHTTYALAFPDIYQSTPTVEIAGFTEAERWKGMYTLDSQRSIDGETGMNIFSMNGTPTKITLQKKLNLKNYGKLYAYLFISDNANLQNLKQLSVGLTDGKGGAAAYNLTGLKVGWNYIAVNLADFQPKIDLSDITTFTVELFSQKNQTTQITLDRIWTQPPLKTDSFAKVDTTYVNLETLSKKTFLHLSSPAPVNTLFTKTTTVSRFAYTVGLSPLKSGTFGLSFLIDPKSTDGYYFLIAGRQMNEWHLIKKEGGHETELQQGALPGGTFENGAMVWIRVEKDGDDISLSYTINGQQYAAVTKYRDSTYNRGNFGLVSTGSYLIDSVDIKE